jgi:secreted Zn-dependent insulinase-like peptidase
VATQSPLGTFRTEPFYGVPYHVQELDCDRQRLDESLQGMPPVHITLPAPNPFICTDLIAADSEVDEAVIPAGEEFQRPLRSTPPVSVVNLIQANSCSVADEDLREMWFSRDEVFRQPRSIFFHLLESQSCGKNCDHL